ncbi:SDR family NAD(P)-dependent oxidoreductase [Paenibacillus kobensis]|uniref:SDR family NAD(P)-dependent oxidoreductase n=1 Tax=Paenibacillus kobensis TaxID=59841 RepID=UPI000FDAE0F9|nr:SDR family NAD(P)-dependent oxidoreductase [Paenibacillus kobensis]
MNHNQNGQSSYKEDDIAVIGIGLQIAGTSSLEQYWEVFENNIDLIRDLPQNRQDDVEDLARIYALMMPNANGKISYNKCGYLEKIDEFDYEFFKLPPIEAQVMDPVQRILLQTIFHAFDDAGYTADMLSGTKTGIYIGYTPGSTKDNYSTNIFHNNPELIKYSNVGNMPCMLPSRASYLLNLRGPTMVIDSACSSSLVAIHDACASIKNGTCSMAIAGGIRLHSFPVAYDDMNVGFETDDNKTRTFDNTASGAAIGEGSAVVLLKPLKDAQRDKDYIYGVIKGSAINNDGTSASITAPNPAAQATVILEALRASGISPEEIDYIETHGTATALGDPIEFRGLTSAYEKFTDHKQFCGLSSSKSNIGHLYEAAGVASFIKALAAIKYKKIPGAAHFNVPNLKIDFCDSPFYINNQTRDWHKDGLRTCAISAFGISGTNAHVILQEYDNQSEPAKGPDQDLLLISAKSMESLVSLIAQYKEFSETGVDVNQFAANANLYRAHYPKRVAVAFENRNQLAAALTRLASSEESQWSRIAGVYYNDGNASKEMDYGAIRAALKRCNTCLAGIGGDPQSASVHEEMKADLDFLADAYSNGAKIDWRIFYQGIEPIHIPIPYYPFKPTRCWLPKKEKQRDWAELERKLSPQAETKAAEAKPAAVSGTIASSPVPVASPEPVLSPVPAEDLDGMYYERIFVQADPIVKNANPGRCLLLDYTSAASSEPLYDSLQQRFYNVDRITVNTDEAKRIGIEKYFDQLYANIGYNDITHIVITNQLGRNEPRSQEELLQLHNISLLGIVALYRKFSNYENKIKIVPILDSCFQVTGQETYLNPNGAPVFGLCKSLNRMFNNIVSCCIDTDSVTEWKTIVDEINAVVQKDIVVYRSGQRFFEGLQEAKVQTSGNSLVIKDQGVYFISGGLGGIGYETAMEMANRAKDVTVILVGRTPLPDSSEWEAIVRRHPDSDMAEKIQRLQSLQSRAKHAEYYAVDIGDDAAVQSLIQSINAKYGMITGVIHGAGISGGITFEQLNEAHFTGILGPKLVGTNVLDQATRSQNLDFFLMFSSISTIFSSADLPGYIAGNIYLDSYSDYRNKETGSRSITVNWATWMEIGMAVKSNFTIDTLFQAVKTKEAISALFAVLHNSSGSVVVARLNLKSKISMLLKTYPMQLSSTIAAALEAAASDAGAVRTSAASDSEDYVNIERTLIEVCCKNLGYTELNVHHNFFELGANSILLSIIYKDLNDIYPGLLQVTDLFSCPTVQLLADHIHNKLLLDGSLAGDAAPERSEAAVEPMASRESVAACASERPALVDSLVLSPSRLEAASARSEEAEPESSRRDERRDEYDDEDGVAIIGVGMELPSANNLNSYWNMLINGINAVRDIPSERAADITNHLLFRGMDEEHIKFRRSGYLDEVSTFDHAFFGISPRDAALLDPVLRIFLQCCSNAIDDAGYGADSVRGTNTGIFLGYTANLGNAYNRFLYEIDPKLFNDALPIGQVSMTASRAAYVFDLKGPSMVVDTACSSSLTALHMACEQIRFGKCDMVLAGGASLMGTPLADGSGVGFESPEEKTRAFSDQASGAAIAEGAGVVLLKSLKKAKRDGDSIYAVIKGSAINQDGSSFGIAAPNYLAQSEVIQKAWKDAGITATDISYIEAHGTGTQLGDPIEIKGISHAFETVTGDKQICGVGSVKTNLGHANEAAGMCGLFKIILALQNKVIPPSLHFQVPNPNIDFIRSPLYVVDKPTPLKPKGSKAIVGISGFGMSGTNAHLILEEAPEAQPIHNQSAGKQPLIFAVSARTEAQVFQLIASYRTYLLDHKNVNLTDFAATLNIGRKHYAHRLAFVYYSQQDLIAKLTELQPYGAFARIANNWCFSGHYAIVPESKKEKFPHELTSKEQQKLSEESNHYCRLSRELKDDERQTIILGYVRGANIEWKSLYNQAYRKLHLPTYPYARKHAWYQIPVAPKAVRKAASKEQSPYEHFFHHKTWVPMDAVPVSLPPQGTTCVVVHSDEAGNHPISKGLRAKGVRVVDVFAANDSFVQADEDTFRIENSVDQFKQLFSQLAEQPIGRIVHAGAYRDHKVQDANELYGEFEHGFFNVVNLVKGVVKARLDQDIELAIVASCAQTISGQERDIWPHNGTVLSFGKSVEQENANIRCRAIDTDMETSIEAIIDQLFADHNMHVIGLRQGKAYVEQFDAAEIAPETANRLVDGGTYIVTGGTSGIGVQNAKLFSKQAKCNLILLSRKGFPDESQWNAYEEQDGYKEIIKDFREMKNNGATLEIMKCDISNSEDVQRVLQTVRDKYNRINGIAHCAGVIEPGFILRKEKSSFLNVFAPKVLGTWNLDIFTQQDQLDFMLLHSSNVTDAGEPGQSCYMAANAFLDSYTDYLNAQGKPAYAVNWVAWKETGMAHKQGTNYDTTTKAITNHDATTALYELLSSKPQRVVIGQFNESVDLLSLVKQSRNKVASGFTAKLYQAAYAKQTDEVAAAAACLAPMQIPVVKPEASPIREPETTVKLTGHVEGTYTAVERQIGSIYGAILGYEEVDIYEGFFEMGGDSILLTEMHEIINKQYPGTVKIADLFEFDSIHSLAEYIAPKIKIEDKPEPLEAPVSAAAPAPAPAPTKEYTLTGNVEGIYTPVEKDIGGIYCSILGYDEVDIYEGFFEMGGDSILLTEMHETINKLHPNIVKIADLFEFDSVQTLSDYITTRLEKAAKSKSQEPSAQEPAPQEPGPLQEEPAGYEYCEMSNPQERIYADYRLSPNKQIYNIGFVSDHSEDTYENMVENANDFFNRFEMLRSTFKPVDKKLVRVVHPIQPVTIERVKVASVADIDYSKHLKTFKLDQYPLFNLTLFEAPDRKLLFFDVHHILLDGYSTTIFLEQMEAYSSKSTAPPLYSYAKYVEFERNFFASEEYRNMSNYWSKRLKGFDFSNPLVIKEADEAACGHKTIVLSDELTDTVHKFAKSRKTTMFNMLLASYGIALQELTQRNDLAVLTPMLNRYLPEFKNAIGVFTNLIPLRLDVQPEQSLGDYIKNVSKTTVDGIKNQYYPYNHLVKDFKSANPAFFFYLDFEDSSLKKFRSTEDIPHAVNIPKFALDVVIKNVNQKYEVCASYKKKYVSDEEAAAILDRMITALQDDFKNDNLNHRLEKFHMVEG